MRDGGAPCQQARGGHPAGGPLLSPIAISTGHADPLQVPEHVMQGMSCAHMAFSKLPTICRAFPCPISSCRQPCVHLPLSNASRRSPCMPKSILRRGPARDAAACMSAGLDARAAAIVMQSVKNVSRNGRTVMVTIHQPSIDIFEAFDALVLLQRGGKARALARQQIPLRPPAERRLCTWACASTARCCGCRLQGVSWPHPSHLGCLFMSLARRNEMSPAGAWKWGVVHAEWSTVAAGAHQVGRALQGCGQEGLTLLLHVPRAQLIYSGLLGPQSSVLISYLEDVPGVHPIRPGENPATWMLEVTGGASVTGQSRAADVDFAEYYRVRGAA